jgi:hypothetical protein
MDMSLPDISQVRPQDHVIYPTFGAEHGDRRVEKYHLPCSQDLDLARITLHSRHPSLLEGKFVHNLVSDMVVYCEEGKAKLFFDDGRSWEMFPRWAGYIPKKQNYFWEVLPSCSQVVLIITSTPRWRLEQHILVK